MQALAGLGKGALAAVGVGYFAVVNAASVGLFWYDKNQALRHGWRVRRIDFRAPACPCLTFVCSSQVPEATLQLSALAGGWLGGMWAMDKFRHKTKKEPFRTMYAAVPINFTRFSIDFPFSNLR